MKVLILGGYGTFGGRLVELLAGESRLTLIVAGRSLEKAQAFCAGQQARATLVPLAFDRDGDVANALRTSAPDLVVDASGPFQFYGDAPYRVVEACIALGIHYLDLADGSDFVNNVVQFDAQARARAVFVLTGASSFPVLTAAVVRKLAHGMTRLNAVTGGIAPSPYAGVGLNVIRAIASYAGKPVADAGTAFVDTRRFTIAPPGRLPLDPIRFSLVDVPDIQALRALWPELKSVWMGAGPVPEILHRALNVLAWMVRARLLPSLSPFAGLMYRVINVLRWGEHRGGMFVLLEGADANGEPIARSWHLLAEGNDGPLIPSMAAAALIRRCLEGRPPAPGARPAVRDLELEDYERLFESRTIYAGIREPVPPDAPLYRRMLGDAWSVLPEPIRAMHDLTADRTAKGIATVERGNGVIARIIAAVFGFPEAGREVPLTVQFQVRDGRETWRRDFAGHAFASRQAQGRGRLEGLLRESFGPFAFGLALVLEKGRLKLVPRRWTAFGIPLPVALAPGGDAFESVDEDGRFRFNVEIGHPLTGPIVTYRGWLKLQA
jgi:hypothetical protein